MIVHPLPMPPWKAAWVHRIAPRLPDSALAALRMALENDDPRLTQGTTVYPNGLRSQDYPEKACPMGYAGWHGESLTTCEKVQAFFNALRDACEADEGASGGEGYFTDFVRWWDLTPREFAVPLLLAAVVETIRERNPTAFAEGVTP